MGFDNTTLWIRCGNTWEWICEVYQDIQQGKNGFWDEDRQVCRTIHEVLDARIREVYEDKLLLHEPTAAFDVSNFEAEIYRQRDCVDYLINRW